jgi:uncharacterized protein (DUF433 family)
MYPRNGDHRSAVLEILAAHPDRRELCEDYPDLEEEEEDPQQALAFARP